MTRTAADLIHDLETTRDETLGFFTLGDEELSRTYGPGKWSVRFLLHHLADAETVLYERIRRVIAGPPQTLLVFDPDAWARELDYALMPPDISRDIFVSVRRGVIRLAGHHYEARGHLTFVHSTMGVRTLREELDKVAAHNARHLSQIRTALVREETR